MTVQKGSVRFDVQPSGLTGLVGTPILVVSAVLDANCHQVVWYRGMWGNISQVRRSGNLMVPLTEHHVEMLAAFTEGELRAALIPAFGVQMAVDLVDP